MRIASSNIQLASQHYEVQQHTRSESITERIRQAAQDTPDSQNTPTRNTQIAQPNRVRIPMPSANPVASGLPTLLDTLDLSTQRDLSDLTAQTNTPLASLETPEGIDTESFELSAEDKARIELIIAAIERISGKKMKFVEPDKALKEAYETPDVENLPAVAQMKADLETSAEAPTPARIREINYHFEESYYESESTTFDAQGIVKTADGQEINIDVSLSMSREFAREISLDVTLEETVKDPLVINYDGTAAELTDRKFAFDIDTDGTADQISFVAPGSGFLALDKNGDGTINNGSELFGAQTGNGFAELAAYDDDGNGWIDEADSVYEGLRIFTKDSNGNDHLMALGQKGVGAIYLGHTDTPFQIKGENNQTQGIVRSSGIFLNENGSAGTVQQLDLVV